MCLILVPFIQSSKWNKLKYYVVKRQKDKSCKPLGNVVLLIQSVLLKVKHRTKRVMENSSGCKLLYHIDPHIVYNFVH